MRSIAFTLSVLMSCAVAGGQANESHQAMWQQAMRELAGALVQEDSAAVAQAVEKIPLFTFSARRGSLVDLFDQCSGSLLITARGYRGTPDRAASDMGVDFASSDLPDAIKRKFMPPDTVAAREADKVAAQWIGDALRADADTFVGLIVLWRGNQSLPSLTDGHTRHVVFVLVAGGFSEETGAPELRRIVFGNPLKAAH